MDIEGITETMQITVDSSQPLAEEAFSLLGNVTLLPKDEITNDALKNTDVLICRSTIKVDEALLAGTPVKFVGCPIIGTDHVDFAYLEANNIGFAAAPGCNANSVSEYFCAAVLKFLTDNSRKLEGLTVGIIGVGNVGKRVAEKARALGLKVLLNDPPRAEAESDFENCGLDTLLSESDIVTLHVPLEKSGKYPTFELAGADFFAKMKNDALLINASRGKVIDQSELEKALDNKQIGAAVLDVFYNEPEIPESLHEKLLIATPHIAGHSYNGKVNGTAQIFDAVCKHYNITKTWSTESLMPAPEVDMVEVESYDNLEDVLYFTILSCYDIMADDEVLRNHPGFFYSYRQNYPLRMEFAQTEFATGDEKLATILSGLGFKKSNC